MPQELLDLSFSLEELKAGFFEAKELRAAGFDARVLKSLGYLPAHPIALIRP